MHVSTCSVKSVNVSPSLAKHGNVFTQLKQGSAQCSAVHHNYHADNKYMIN